MVRMSASRRMTLKATRVKVPLSHLVSHICQACDADPLVARDVFEKNVSLDTARVRPPRDRVC